MNSYQQGEVPQSIETEGVVEISLLFLRLAINKLSLIIYFEKLYLLTKTYL